VNTELDPDYMSHDAVYRQRRASGAVGWDNDAGYVALLGLVETRLLTTLPAGCRILELGCGAGNLSLLMAEHGWQMTGVDIAPAAIDWATARSNAFPGVDFRVDDVLHLATCADTHFDAVVDGHCLHCIIGPDRRRCLVSVHRVLKDNGALLVVTMCGEVVDAKLRATYDPATRSVSMNGRPVRYIGAPDDIMAEISSAGFAIHDAQVVPRVNDSDQDTLVLLARKIP
jgi:SAM-dependent methyltransferase